jgi:hypothetical protein
MRVAYDVDHHFHCTAKIGRCSNNLKMQTMQKIMLPIVYLPAGLRVHSADTLDKCNLYDDPSRQTNYLLQKHNTAQIYTKSVLKNANIHG